MEHERITRQLLQIPKVKEYLATLLRIASEFRQLTIDWTNFLDQGAEALRSARISPVRAVASLNTVVDQLQAIVDNMTRTRDQYLTTLQQPPTLPSSLLLPSQSPSSSSSPSSTPITVTDLKIPGTQTNALILFSDYIDPTWQQCVDELALKSSGILTSLETIASLKDSGADDLPPLLDSQLTNLILLWELEPYRDVKENAMARESRLGVVEWKLAK
ncbi:hypothetical protein BGW41_005005 [Actinomortierella wolfii]|nr:hypothetical protein BGW41_005005 [Actinomortierella wolfii]